jgi:hypothetical protein
MTRRLEKLYLDCASAASPATSHHGSTQRRMALLLREDDLQGILRAGSCRLRPMPACGPEQPCHHDARAPGRACRPGDGPDSGRRWAGCPPAAAGAAGTTARGQDCGPSVAVPAPAQRAGTRGRRRPPARPAGLIQVAGAFITDTISDDCPSFSHVSYHWHGAGPRVSRAALRQSPSRPGPGHGH